MTKTGFDVDALISRARSKWGLISTSWAFAVLLFASQWYIYDSIHSSAGPFVYYLWWSWYMWAVLTPFVLWFSISQRIDSHSWKWVIPQHIAASVILTLIQVSIETSVEWLGHQHEFAFRQAFWHYLTQHTQLNLLTYWVLVAVAQFYQMYDQARRRQLQAARLEARLAEAQLGLLRMQLQPHFLFNTLQAATELVHEDPDGAEDILLRFSQLLRVSLDEFHVQEIPLAREIEFLEHYMGIQQRRFGDRLRFDLQVDKGVLACAVPSLVLQPLVENAVRHGIGKHKGKDVVTVRVLQGAGHLCLEVHNATGTLTKPREQLMQRGTGLANTQARLRQLYEDRQSLELFNLDPKGVCVALAIPLRWLPPTEQSLEAVESHR
jgi:two-component system LytT family sensor kinase